MSEVVLKCPNCASLGEYDFTERSEQESEYEIECSSCGDYFTVFNEWLVIDGNGDIYDAESYFSGTLNRLYEAHFYKDGERIA